MKTKICVRCNESKDISEFYKKKKENRVSSWCRKCLYDAQHLRWKDRKRKAVDLLGGKCCKCDYNKNLAALEFHHKNKNNKKYDWAKLQRRKWNDIIKELKKCILLCSNCHKELHFPGLNLSPYIKGQDNNVLNWKHKAFKPTGECPWCGEGVYGTKFCSVKCASFARRKSRHPRKKTLEKLLKDTNYCVVGRKYGVSDNAVRKWAKKYGII